MSKKLKINSDTREFLVDIICQIYFKDYDEMKKFLRKLRKNNAYNARQSLFYLGLLYFKSKSFQFRHDDNLFHDELPLNYNNRDAITMKYRHETYKLKVDHDDEFQLVILTLLHEKGAHGWVSILIDQVPIFLPINNVKREVDYTDQRKMNAIFLEFTQKFYKKFITAADNGKSPYGSVMTSPA